MNRWVLWILLLGVGGTISAQTATDPALELQRRIDSGAVKLTFDPQRGYLDSLLKAFSISPSSQVLNFAKSSFQIFLTSPETPRAIYFNDDVYVGWVRGGEDIEIAAVDPRQGSVFYTLSQDRNKPPKIVRQGAVQCLVCHDIQRTAEPIPRLLMLSVLPDRVGSAVGAASLLTNDQSPISERWGGWYVTGTHGNQKHLGNKVYPQTRSKIDIRKYAAENTDLSAGSNLTDLSSRLNTKPFLTPHSDIVALMVLGHQTHIHNLMTLANHVAKAPRTPSEVTESAEDLLQAMLFVKAAPLGASITGSTRYAEEFSSRGPRDSKGRSLRQLDLKQRLLRYPLSYLIYSPSFDSLAPAVRAHVVKRLREVLSGQDRSETFSHLSAPDRAAILEILKETKPDLFR